MIKLCSHSEPAHAASSSQHHLGFNLGALLRLTRQPPVSGQPSSRPASKTLPATQQKPIERELMEAAQRARQSPDLSLFNRLHGLVLQLHKSRDFFIDWPQQVCNRIRGRHESQLPRAVKLGPAPGAGAGLNGAPSCWNGRDFSGYTKPLAPFGATSGLNPEVAPLQQPISRIILDQVARLKDIGTRLSKLASRSASGSALELLSLTSKLTTKSGPVAPSAEAQVSQVGHRDDDQPQQLRATSGATLIGGGHSGGGGSELDEHEAAIVSLVAENEAAGSTVGDRPDPDETDAEEADGEAAEGDGDGDDNLADTDGTLADSAAVPSGHDNDEDDLYMPPCKTEDCSDLLTKIPEYGNEHGAGSTNAHDLPYLSSPANPTHHYASGHSSNAITTPGADLYPPGSFVNINQIGQQQQLQQPAELYPPGPQHSNNDYKLLHVPALPPAQSSSASPLVMVAQLNGLACSLLALLVAHLWLVPMRHRL